jgi:hypothetical protein
MTLSEREMSEVSGSQVQLGGVVVPVGLSPASRDHRLGRPVNSVAAIKACMIRPAYSASTTSVQPTDTRGTDARAVRSILACSEKYRSRRQR